MTICRTETDREGWMILKSNARSPVTRLWDLNDCEPKDVSETHPDRQGRTRPARLMKTLCDVKEQRHDVSTTDETCTSPTLLRTTISLKGESDTVPYLTTKNKNSEFNQYPHRKTLESGVTLLYGYDERTRKQQNYTLECQRVRDPEAEERCVDVFARSGLHSPDSSCGRRWETVGYKKT